MKRGAFSIAIKGKLENLEVRVHEIQHISLNLDDTCKNCFGFFMTVIFFLVFPWIIEITNYSLKLLKVPLLVLKLPLLVCSYLYYHGILNISNFTY